MLDPENQSLDHTVNTITAAYRTMKLLLHIVSAVRTVFRSLAGDPAGTFHPNREPGFNVGELGPKKPFTAK